MQSNRSILLFLWHHMKPYWFCYVLLVLAPVVGSFYPFVYNYAIKLFLDIMVHATNPTYGDFLFPIALFLITQVVLDLVWRLSNVAEWRAEPYVRRSILLQSYNTVQHYPYRFFQDNFSGAISSKLKGLLDGYDKFWAEMHHGLLSRVMHILVGFGALAFVNKHLGLFIATWGILYVAIMYKLSGRLNDLSCAETDSKHDLIGQVSDRITNIISLFSFASRAREYKALYQQMTDDFIPKQLRTYHYGFLIRIVGSVFYWCLFGFLLFYMIHLRMAHVISVGDFAFVFGMTLVVVEDIWHVTMALQDFSRAMGDFKSSLTLLTVPQQSGDSPQATPLIIRTPRIEFQHVSFGYGEDKPVFTDLSLCLEPGERVGLVGRSGAGKSSLVNLLLRYFPVQSGSILIDQQDITVVTEDSLRSQIAVIPQDTLLFHRSLLENIRYGRLDATDEEIMAAAQKAHLHEFISNLPKGYETHVGERGIKLSGGQRQRIAIARAFLKEAPILILDEATSSLDSQTEKLIQDSLGEVIDRRGQTVLAIAHRLSTLKHMDRILVLDKGCLVEEGTHDELLRRPDSLYKELWTHQEI